MKKIKEKSPVRLSFGSAGDTDYYIELIKTGCCINATINLYSYCELKRRDDKKIGLYSVPTEERVEYDYVEDIEYNSRTLNLMKAVTKYYKPQGIDIITDTDVPLESGLGGSAAHSVSMIRALNEWMMCYERNEDVAKLAYRLEREELGIEGGYQDQWASTYRGFNYMTFSKDGPKVYPINLDDNDLQYLENRLLLVYVPREQSGTDIHEHQKATREKQFKMLLEKKQNIELMKYYLDNKEFDKFGARLDIDWQLKKKATALISNKRLNNIYDIAVQNGALGGRMIGAGAGGNFLFYCDGIGNKKEVLERLQDYSNKIKELPFIFERI